MKYQKYLIIASKKDPAGINITTQLSRFRKTDHIRGREKVNPNLFDFYLVDEEIIEDKNLDKEKINQYDFIIFASRHQSKSKKRTLSIHAPGNWRLASFGGENRKASKTSALFSKFMFEKLNENMDKNKLTGFQPTLEVTHHGPLIDKPCLFIEIGSTLQEWKNNKAGFVIAKTILEAIQKYKENPYREICVGIGGNHYCQGFNKLQLSSNAAIGHVIPKYALPLTREMIKEAIEKTEEELDLVLLDWKGLGNSMQREQVLKVLNELKIEYKRTSNVGK